MQVFDGSCAFLRGSIHLPKAAVKELGIFRICIALDLLCVLPKLISRENFFSTLYDQLLKKVRSDFIHVLV